MLLGDDWGLKRRSFFERQQSIDDGCNKWVASVVERLTDPASDIFLSNLDTAIEYADGVVIAELLRGYRTHQYFRVTQGTLPEEQVGEVLKAACEADRVEILNAFLADAQLGPKVRELLEDPIEMPLVPAASKGSRNAVELLLGLPDVRLAGLEYAIDAAEEEYEGKRVTQR